MICYVAETMTKTDNIERKIFNAFYALLKEMPIAEINVKLITDKAGVNRTYFYDFFDDKYDLINQALVDINQPIFNLYIQAYGEKNHQNYKNKVKQSIIYINRHAQLLQQMFLANNDNTQLLNSFQKRLISAIKRKTTTSDVNQATLDYFSFVYSSATLATIKWMVFHKELPIEVQIGLIDRFTWNIMNSF